MLDPAYRWDSVQNVPSSATTKLRAIFNVAEMGRFNVGEIGTGTNIGV